MSTPLSRHLHWFLWFLIAWLLCFALTTWNAMGVTAAPATALSAAQQAIQLQITAAKVNLRAGPGTNFVDWQRQEW